MPEAYQDAGLWDMGTDSYSSYPTYTSNTPGGIDFSGIGQTIADIAKIGASTWSQNTLMQTSIQGQRYIEGQRLVALNSTLGVKPGTLLIVGGALLVYLMMKG